MLKILQLNKLYYPYIGGIEHVVQQIAEGLNQNTNMKVLVCQDKGKGSSEQINGVSVTRTASLGILSSMPISLKYPFAVRKAAKECDILILHMPFPLGDLALLLSGFRGRVILIWHCDIVRQKRLMKLYRPLMNWTLRRADTIITATEGHIKDSDYLNIYKDKCMIIPYGVSQNIYNDSCAYINKNHNHSSQNENEITFLFVGRLVYYKGCDILINAFANAMKTYKEENKTYRATLRIAGSGPLKNELEELTEKLDIKDSVIFIGNVNDDELKQEYRGCDVFVLPSTAKSEAFGLVQIEAMSYGKPVINTNLPSGVPYVGIHNITGLTVEPSDINSLSEAILFMMKNPDKRNEMGIAARQQVEDIYLEETMMTDLMKIFEEK